MMEETPEKGDTPDLSDTVANVEITPSEIRIPGGVIRAEYVLKRDLRVQIKSLTLLSTKTGKSLNILSRLNVPPDTEINMLDSDHRLGPGVVFHTNPDGSVRKLTAFTHRLESFFDFIGLIHELAHVKQAEDPLLAAIIPYVGWHPDMLMPGLLDKQSGRKLAEVVVKYLQEKTLPVPAAFQQTAESNSRTTASQLVWRRRLKKVAEAIVEGDASRRAVEWLTMLEKESEAKLNQSFSPDEIKSFLPKGLVRERTRGERARPLKATQILVLGLRSHGCAKSLKAQLRGLIDHKDPLLDLLDKMGI